jgi:hypothetical protein
MSNQRLLCLFLTAVWTSAPGSFLFSLRNNDDLAPFKAPLRHENHRGAIYHYSGFGPTFGWYYDLYIADNAGSNTRSRTDFGYSYQPPPGYNRGESNTRSLLPGSFYFTPSQIEVLYLN